MNPASDRLVEGGKFRVRYRLDSQRRDRVFVGRYLGYNKVLSRHDFDLRPAAGTSGLADDAILEVELVHSDTPCSQPVMI